MTEAEKRAQDRSRAAKIAEELRTAILEGRLAMEERLPGEPELAERFGVSRPTIREALKRLAAQNLIRSRRGPTGGTFVNRISWAEAHDGLAMLATLVIGMQGARPAEVVEARRALLSACLPLACERRAPGHLEAMREEIALQRDAATSDEGFCASDVRFHRALADATGNPVLAFQMAGVVEGMQPLLNMITYRARDRRAVADAHEALANAIEAEAPEAAAAALDGLTTYVAALAEGIEIRP